MAKTTTAADKIEAGLKSAAKESGSKRLSSKSYNPISNLGDFAHPPKKKSKKK